MFEFGEKLVLEKMEIDLSDYERVFLEDGKIELTKIKRKNISLLGQINSDDITGSKILSCKINDFSIPDKKCKFKNILNIIYDLINDGPQIIKNTLIKMKTIILNDKGYKHNPKLGLSIETGMSSFKSIQEIFNQCQINAIKLHMEIKSRDNTIICLKTEPEIKKTLTEEFIRYINNDKFSCDESIDSEYPEEEDERPMPLRYTSERFIDRISDKPTPSRKKLDITTPSSIRSDKKTESIRDSKKDDVSEWLLINKQLALLKDTDFLILSIESENYKINNSLNVFNMDNRRIGNIVFNSKTSKIEIK